MTRIAEDGHIVTEKVKENHFSYMALPGLTGKPKLVIGSGITVNNIIECVCNFYDVQIKSVVGKRRAKELVTCRYTIIYFMKTYTTLSLKRIGELLGNRDHTTVIHGLRTIQNHIETEEKTRSQIEAIRAQII